MKILLQDFQTGLYLGRSRRWTQNPEKARTFQNRFRAGAYKVWHRLPRACVVAMPGEGVKPRSQRPAHCLSGNRQVSERRSMVGARLELSPGNALFIRGEGGGLSWHQGQPLRPIDNQSWVWHSCGPGDSIVFQLLLNDLIWAKGDDITLEPGCRIELTPDFEWPEIPRFTYDTLQPFRTVGSV